MKPVIVLSWFLQEGPAETTGYMIFGFAVIFGVMLLYLFSLRSRKRNLEGDLTILEDIEKNFLSDNDKNNTA
jgi:hypothetical protein